MSYPSDSSQPKPIALEIQNLTIQFGGLKAVSNLNLAVRSGSILGVIGPNGAGKTTVFNALTGVYQPTEGNLFTFGKKLNGLKPHQITHLGLARTFQNIRLFKNLSVLDNILIAMDNDPRKRRHGIVASVLRTQAASKTELDQTQRGIELLELFQLSSKIEVQAQNLSYGDQRRLEIIRAIATGAQVLLLDEPAAGMNPNETQSLMEAIRKIRDHYGMTLLLIEHDMKLVMGICEQIVVLDYGVKIAEGNPSHIQTNSRVIEAYLGKAAPSDAQNGSQPS